MGCGGSSAAKEEAQKDRRRLSVSKSEAVVSDGNDDRNRFTKAQADNLLELFPEAERRLSLQGQQADATQKGFDNKKCDKKGDQDNPADLGIGFACKKGLKPESPNQDDFFILQVDNPLMGLYGVFDGHGPYGHDVSNFVHETLPGLLVRDGNFTDAPLKALANGFKRCHQMCEQAGQKGRFDCSLSGTTCTVVIQTKECLHAAHAGDSRSVMADFKDGKYVASDLTDDHKPELPNEKKRIEQNGGQVRRLEGDVPHRVFQKGKLYPGLAMSRSIGDCVAQSCGVTCDPDTRTVKLGDMPNLKFFMLCSDGVWEFISSQEAVDIVAKFPKADVQKGAESLAQEAWKRWIKEEGNVVDDITVIVVWF